MLADVLVNGMFGTIGVFLLFGNGADVKVLMIFQKIFVRVVVDSYVWFYLDMVK